MGGVVAAVIAISNPLYKGLVNNEAEKWGSFCDLCKTNNIAIWVVEQSAVRQIQGPKSKSTTKVKAATKPKVATRAKAAAKPKVATRAKAAAKPKTATRAKAAAMTKRK